MSAMLKIAPTDDCLATYNKLQQAQKDKSEQLKWITFMVKDGKIVVESQQGPKKDISDDDGYKKFAAALQESGKPRWGALDYKDKVFFVSWTPDTAGVKDKMTYSSVREAFKGALSGVNHTIAATDSGELAQDVFDKKVKSV